jgi:hypothetical protein
VIKRGAVVVGVVFTRLVIRRGVVVVVVVIAVEKVAFEAAC